MANENQNGEGTRIRIAEKSKSNRMEKELNGETTKILIRR